MPLPAPGALHRDPFTAAGGIHLLDWDAPKGFVHEHPSGIRVDEAAPPAALAIYRDRLVMDALGERGEPAGTKGWMMLTHAFDVDHLLFFSNSLIRFSSLLICAWIGKKVAVIISSTTTSTQKSVA